MTNIASGARLAAGLVALIAFIGLALQLAASLGEAHGALGAALWAMFRFFTIIGNLLTMLVFAGFALGARAVTPRVVGGITLMMMLVGIVYVTMLRGTLVLSGAAYVADIVMHYVSPLLVVLFWLILAPKGGLSSGDPLRWSLLPLAYLPYALARGVDDGKYPYPFIDVGKIGLQQALINAAVIALGFLIAGYALVWLDRRMSTRT